MRNSGLPILVLMLAAGVALYVAQIVVGILALALPVAVVYTAAYLAVSKAVGAKFNEDSPRGYGAALLALILTLAPIGGWLFAGSLMDAYTTNSDGMHH